MKNKQKGFTLIELLVVVAIIALLSSIALIALISARTKSRDVKRLSDITQMNTALELYFSTNKGYPSATNGIPDGLRPGFASNIPVAPTPADGDCDGLSHPFGAPNQPPVNAPANTYYYVPIGPFVLGSQTFYSDYIYYFCLGQKTGNFDPGLRQLTPRGVR